MLTIEINKTFANYEECEKYEEENFPNRQYQGHAILCINKEYTAGNDEITITSIMCF